MVPIAVLGSVAFGASIFGEHLDPQAELDDSTELDLGEPLEELIVTPNR